MFLAPSDFKDKYELHTGMYDSGKLQTYIDKYEARYLTQLLGVDLYNQFISDIDSLLKVPKSPNFRKIFYPLYEDVNMFHMIESDGILEMLKGFIYFEYSKDLMMQQTSVGGVQPKNENSKVMNSTQTLIYHRYNEGIRTYKAIQDWILLNTLSPIGQVVSFDIVNAGTNYINTQNIALIGGTGTDCMIDIETTDGEITTISISNQGTGYSIGDTFQLSGGDDNAEITISYVGIGTLGDFKGQRKGMAYWI